MSKKTDRGKSFDDLQELAEQVAKSYPEKSGREVEELPEEELVAMREPNEMEFSGMSGTDSEEIGGEKVSVSAEELSSVEKQKLLLEAKQALDEEMSHFHRSRQRGKLWVKAVALLTVLTGFSGLFFNVSLPGVSPAMKWAIFAMVLFFGGYSLMRSR